jgi:HAD superfamily hydrolase (TIGR01509 family)
MPAIILFDVMETLVTEPYYRAMPSFFGMTPEQLREAKHPTSWIEFEEGRLTEAEYLPRFFRDGRPVDGDGLRRCVTEAYNWLDGMQQLLADLKHAGHAMYALSNYPVWYEMIEEKLRLSRYLRWSFVSCRTGVRKPDRRAFLGAAEALQVSPAECVFVDDQKRNVEAAQSVGMDTIHSQSAAQVREELVRRGLL